LNTEGN